MYRKTRSTVAFTVLTTLAGHAASRPANANEIILIDRTGSMSELYNGGSTTKAEEALRILLGSDRAAGSVPGDASTRGYAGNLTSAISGQVAVYAFTNSSSAGATDFIELLPFTSLSGGTAPVENAVQNAFAAPFPSGQTPLADSICGIYELLSTGDRLRIVTDGLENASDGPCSGPSSEFDHGAPFDNALRMGLDPINDQENAGGLVPGTWEWNVFFTVYYGFVAPSAASAPLFQVTPTVNILLSLDSLYGNELQPSAFAPSSFSLPNVTLAGGMSPGERALFSTLSSATGGSFRVYAGDDAVSTFVPEDVDSNGDVDASDYQSVRNYLGQVVSPYNAAPSLDVNGNGLIDRSDLALVAAAAPEIPFIWGDVDFNLCTDQSDLNQVLQFFGTSIALGTQHSIVVDLNGDGFIDDDDVDLVVTYWGDGCVNPPPPPVL